MGPAAENIGFFTLVLLPTSKVDHPALSFLRGGRSLIGCDDAQRIAIRTGIGRFVTETGSEMCRDPPLTGITDESVPGS